MTGRKGGAVLLFLEATLGLLLVDRDRPGRSCFNLEKEWNIVCPSPPQSFWNTLTQHPKMGAGVVQAL